MATMNEIASRIGVSPATVSRVLNGRPGVSQDKRVAVMEAVLELGFPKERSPRSGVRTVAIISPQLSNPIFPSFLNTLVTLLAQRNTLALVCSYSLSGTSEDGFLSLLSSQPLLAGIFLGGHYDIKGATMDAYQALADRGIPLTFINGGEHGMEGLYTGTDDVQATNMTLRHLRDLGHEKIGLLLGDRNHYPSVAKHQAALEYFADWGVRHDPSLTAWTTYGVESGAKAAHGLLENGASAILCANDQLAMGALRAAQTLGLDVPGDVSVTGYDDAPGVGDMIPALTTVRQPVYRICSHVVNRIFSFAQGEAVSKKEVLLFGPDLIVRDTTGRYHQKEK